MNKQWKSRFAFGAAMLVGAVVSFPGCGETEGPAPKAGEGVTAKDAATSPGPADDAGKKLDKAGEP
jgi:hypothetical protein